MKKDNTVSRSYSLSFQKMYTKKSTRKDVAEAWLSLISYICRIFFKASTPKRISWNVMLVERLQNTRGFFFLCSRQLSLKKAFRLVTRGPVSSSVMSPISNSFAFFSRTNRYTDYPCSSRVTRMTINTPIQLIAWILIRTYSSHKDKIRST